MYENMPAMTPYAMLRVQRQFISSKRGSQIGKGCALVREGYSDDSEECWDGVSDVVPVDLAHVANHERANNYKGATGSPGRYAGKDGGEEDRDKEGKAGRHRCDASLATLCISHDVFLLATDTEKPGGVVEVTYRRCPSRSRRMLLRGSYP